MAHLDEHKLLSDMQRAFSGQEGHSCETQLTMIINDWAKRTGRYIRIGFSEGI